MPIYAYRCESCGHAMDVLRKVSDPALTTCPACGAEALRKQVTAAGFQLKGSGWYVTDFRDTQKAPATGAAAGAKPDTANGGEARSQPAADIASPAGDTGVKSAPAASAPAAASTSGTASKTDQ